MNFKNHIEKATKFIENDIFNTKFYDFLIKLVKFHIKNIKSFVQNVELLY